MRRCRHLKPDVASMPSDVWMCGECQNLNYTNRKWCNMRSCRAPRGFAPVLQLSSKTDVGMGADVDRQQQQ